ncbi:hypothetical protein DH2020_006443 [Rehmannia glutinosa]|uniref:Protein kinase domain-containing protein n=1 Tax=Rehmannia glutinosa TaxID=99300 RepID=A0ABR0XJ73_REHGL
MTNIERGESKSSPWRIFTYKELHAATNGFGEDYKLGEGGFGSVYWGKTSDGLQIAVKKLKSMNSKAEMEFAVEVEVLGRVRHKNLLGLRGYCAGNDQRLIVYDYMPNLSLLSHLHGQFAAEVQLDWKKRMKIALGSAEGLLIVDQTQWIQWRILYMSDLFELLGLRYLHHEVTPHIIHRDIKASNVLLDSNFEPLVADFGFAKLIPEGVSHMTTRVKGTLGYLAPEYAMWGKVSERRIKDVVDPKLRGNFNENQLIQTINVAALCVQNEADKRPTMKEVVALLKGEAFNDKGSNMRIKSVKYGEDLMALDQESDDEDGKNGYEDESSVYGVFGALETQRMQDPYRHYGNRR